MRCLQLLLYIATSLTNCTANDVAIDVIIIICPIKMIILHIVKQKSSDANSLLYLFNLEENNLIYKKHCNKISFE